MHHLFPQAIDQAHASLAPRDLRLANGTLVNASVNRSPSAYAANPEQERAMYKPYDTDKEMTLLSVVDPVLNMPVACISWFAVHCTSVNNKNQLVNGDNKGVASMLLEASINGQGGPAGGGGTGANHGMSATHNGTSTTTCHGTSTATHDGNPTTDVGKTNMSTQASPKFVAAFAQASVGDTSPNTMGAFCLDTGLPCDPLHSTCNGRNELCIGRGPGSFVFPFTSIGMYMHFAPVLCTHVSVQV